MIIRFIPKGTAISDIPVTEVKRVEDWLNNYPRRILGGLSAKDRKKKIAKDNPDFAA